MKWLVTVGPKIYVAVMQPGWSWSLGTADMYLSSLQWFRHNNFTYIFCLLYTAPQLNICTDLYLYTYRDRRSQWIFLIQDRVTYIRRRSCLEGNIICWCVFMSEHMYIYMQQQNHVTESQLTCSYHSTQQFTFWSCPFHKFLKEWLQLGRWKAEKCLFSVNMRSVFSLTKRRWSHMGVSVWWRWDFVEESGSYKTGWLRSWACINHHQGDLTSELKVTSCKTSLTPSP